MEKRKREIEEERGVEREMQLSYVCCRKEERGLKKKENEWTRKLCVPPMLGCSEE